LDAEFEQKQGEILRKDPILDLEEAILDLEEAYAYVRRDAVRRITLNNETDLGESSAMMARRAKPRTYRSTNTGPINRAAGPQNNNYEIGKAKTEYVCTHCGETGHTKLKCYELIGYPEWWDLAKAPRKHNQRSNTHALAAVAEHTTACTPLNNSALVTTSGIVAELTIAPKDDSTLITTSGKVLHTSSTRNSNEWIIDSGATDHMTFDNLCLQSLKPSEQHIISTENGTPSHVVGEGSVTLTK
jgi:hypothetical protein